MKAGKERFVRSSIVESGGNFALAHPLGKEAMRLANSPPTERLFALPVRESGAYDGRLRSLEETATRSSLLQNGNAGGLTSVSGSSRQSVDVFRELEILVLKQVLDVWMTGAMKSFSGSPLAIDRWSGVIGDVFSREIASGRGVGIASAIRMSGAKTR